MIDFLKTIFGQGQHLTIMQMICRAVVVFFATLLFIRLAGRRSFGLRNPLDNIVAITLGALLSRAIVGVSSFFGIMAASVVIVLLHRAVAWLSSRSPMVSKWVEGDHRIVYREGKFNEEEMRNALLSKDDLLQGVRETALMETLADVDTIRMEKDGRISATKKNT